MVLSVWHDWAPELSVGQPMVMAEGRGQRYGNRGDRSKAVWGAEGSSSARPGFLRTCGGGDLQSAYVGHVHDEAKGGRSRTGDGGNTEEASKV
ncbi:vegetative cell wall protein gp1-like [Iris pallida]|uniref:Vegetative cell wall protein gp1-like n=1 Tax=Iris pallida TaxID=29817 RepID=A0AAX6E7B6_IRIPA|nr:vegetative cell wall protein gp1-like [Iris pallida]